MSRRTSVPLWMYDGETPERLLVIRKTGRTAVERTITAVAKRAERNANTLANHIGIIRKVAAGELPARTSAERQGASLFIQTWDSFAPSQAELAKLRNEGRAEAAITPARAASMADGMARLRSKLIDRNGGGK